MPLKPASKFLFFLSIPIILKFETTSGQSGGWTNWFLRVAVEPEIEFCGSANFYCPARKICVPRDERCVVGVQSIKNACPNQNRCYSVSWNPSWNMTEPDLEEMEDRFFIYRAYSSILESGSSGAMSGGRGSIRNQRLVQKRQKRNVKQALRTLIFDPWKHSFVQYRGFVYEFGKYGVQELDINDPNYKYEREWTAGWKIIGVSRCSRSDLWRFIRKWNFFRGNYLWYANNCHHFSNAFIKYLKADCAVDYDIIE